MKNFDLYKYTSIFLIVLAVSSYFVGFYLNENSAGSGSFDGDFGHIWRNLYLFVNNDINSSLNHPDYHDSRLPASYLMHEFLNPFIETKIGFRRSVFIISLLLPFLFFLSLKQKFKQTDNLLLLLVSSVVFISPYFRTSAFWGLQENYGLIFLLLSFLSLNYFLNTQDVKNYKIFLKISLVTFFSSFCFYFDQKLLIIPLLCFFQIMMSSKSLNLKILTIFFYFMFSLPYIYLIILWGSLITPAASDVNNLGGKLFSYNIGYTITIIAFYIFPILFFLEKNILIQIKDFFLNKKNYYLLLIFIIYIIYFLNFINIENLPILGKGIIYKLSLVLFEKKLLQEIFTYFSFFAASIFLLIFLNRNLKNILILLYFLLLSAVMAYTLQEYFDPLVILMAFTFFNSKIIINYKNSMILYIYAVILLIGSNIYYANNLVNY